MKTFTYDGSVKIEKEVYQGEFSVPSFISIDAEDPNDVHMDGDQLKFYYDITRADILKLLHGMSFRQIRAIMEKNTNKEDMSDIYRRPVTMCLHSSQFPIIKMFDPEFDEEARGDVWVRFWPQGTFHYVKDADGNNVMEPVWNKWRNEWDERAKTFKTFKISTVLEVESEYLDEIECDYDVDVCEA